MLFSKLPKQSANCLNASPAEDSSLCLQRMATRNREAQQTPLTTRWQARDRKGSAFTTTIPNESTTQQDNTCHTTRPP